MSAPINVFRTVTARIQRREIPDPSEINVVYTAPPNNTAIVLMAQISNNNVPDLNDLTVPDPNNARVDFAVQELGGTDLSYLVRNYLVAPSQSTSLLSGKLVLQENQNLVCSFTALAGVPDTPNDGVPDAAEGVDLILSVLEARNA